MYFQPSEYNHIHGLFKAETNTKNTILPLVLFTTSFINSLL